MIKYILVDLSNFAFFGVSKRKGKKIARYENIRILKEFFKRFMASHTDIQVIFIADATLRHQIDDKNSFHQDINDGIILEAPAGSRADDYLIEFLNQNPCDSIIISNDRFQEYRLSRSTLPRWRYPGMIICSQFIIPGLFEAFEEGASTTDNVLMGVSLEGGI